MKKYIFIILSLLFAIQLQAQIITDRPDQTESTAVVGAGNLQIESGILRGIEGEGDFEYTTLLAPSTLFRYGLCDKIELRITNQFEHINSEYADIKGISNLELGAKVQLYTSEESRFELAFLSHVQFPVGSDYFSYNNAFASINKLAASFEINEKIGLGANLGYDIDSRTLSARYKQMFSASLAMGIAINDKAGVFIEAYGSKDYWSGSILNFDSGFTYLLKENFQLDFSFGSGLNHKMNYIAGGFSWLILKD